MARILIVEDETEISAALAYDLKLEGYEVEVAAERVPARVSLQPFYDPASERVKC